MAKISFSSGDVNITKLEVMGLKGGSSFPLLGITSSIDIYESILSPIMTAEISVRDDLGIRESVPIIGNKTKIKIEFDVPKQGSRVIEMVVSEVKAAAATDNAQGSDYVLVCCSMEILNNSSEYFKGPLVASHIDDYIKKMLTDKLKTKKRINIDPKGTKGTQTLDLPVMKPFQVIDKLKRKAVSKVYKSNVYVFFENKDGFNFFPVEYLTAEAAKKSKVSFAFDSAVQFNALSMTYRNVLSYTHMAQQSTASLVHEGALNNRTFSYDPRTKSSQITDYKSSSKEFKKGKGDKDLIPGELEGDYGKKPGKTYHHIQSSVNPDTYLVDKLGKSNAFIEQLTQNIVRIMVWGDPSLTAGDRIDVKIPTPKGLTKAKNKQDVDSSPLVSGEYLISHLRHIISKVDTDFRYFCSMELVKPFYSRTGA